LRNEAVEVRRIEHHVAVDQLFHLLPVPDAAVSYHLEYRLPEVGKRVDRVLHRANALPQVAAHVAGQPRREANVHGGASPSRPPPPPPLLSRTPNASVSHCLRTCHVANSLPTRMITRFICKPVSRVGTAR
ncbi:unnamed protein product, partial [Musa banksii]